mmetsp:Transcript_29425/g.71723  ORF Transcript_29425/g.71723 Transcript_29425/m.71723 type:complete len:1018 (-) Transcript_29425:138-3191(-)
MHGGSFFNISSFKAWSYSFHESSTIALIYNQLEGGIDAYTNWALNEGGKVLFLNNRIGTSFKIDLWTSSVLRSAYQPGSSQQNSRFSLDQQGLPQDCKTDEEKRQYFDFIANYGTHYVESAILGYQLYTYLEIAQSDALKIGFSFESEARAAVEFLLFAVGLQANIDASIIANISNTLKARSTFGIISIGGNPTMLDVHSKGSWISTVNSLPGIVNVTYRNISDLILDQRRASCLQDCIDSYLSLGPYPKAANENVPKASCAAPAGLNISFSDFPQSNVQRKMRVSHLEAIPFPFLRDSSLGNVWDVKAGVVLGKIADTFTFVENNIWMYPFNDLIYKIPDGVNLEFTPAGCLKANLDFASNTSAYLQSWFGLSFDYFNVFAFKVLPSDLFDAYGAQYRAEFVERGLLKVDVLLAIELFSVSAKNHFRLDPTLISNMADLPLQGQSQSLKAYDQFISKWGTHYISRLKFGGYCNISVTFERDHVANVSSDEVEMAAVQSTLVHFLNPFKVKVFLWDLVQNLEKFNVSKQVTNSIRNFSWDCAGGDDSILRVNRSFFNMNSSTSKFDKWKLTIPARPVPIPKTMKFRPISDLVRDSDLPSRTWKKDQINKAIKRKLKQETSNVSSGKKEMLPTSVYKAESSPEKDKSFDASAPRVAMQMVPGVCTGTGSVGVGCGYDATKLDAFGVALNPLRPVIRMQMCNIECYLNPQPEKEECEHCVYSPPEYFNVSSIYRVPWNVEAINNHHGESKIESVCSASAEEFDEVLVNQYTHTTGIIVKHHHSKTVIDFYHKAYEQNQSMSLTAQSYVFHNVELAEPPEPTLELQIALRFLPGSRANDGDRNKYRNFLETFGTHYMYEAQLGGIALATTYFHSCFLDIYSGEEVSEFSSTSAFIIYNDVHGGGHGHMKRNTLFEEVSATTVKLMGGDASIHGILDKNHKLDQDDIDKWKRSLINPAKMVPVKVKLLPITDLIEDDIKRNLVNESIYDYLEEVGAQTLDMIQHFVPPDPSRTPKWCKSIA